MNIKQFHMINTNSDQTMEPIIQNAFIQYHDPSIEFPFPLLETNTNDRFGIAQINVNPLAEVKLPHQHLVFTIDKSGSMSYLCKDKKTKMDHIIFTLENMIRLFSKVTACDISIHVNTFDDRVTCCVETITITPENTKDISDKIKAIHPESSTNIEKALKYANKHMDSYRAIFPTHEITHIFLTDGVPTNGSVETDYLKSLVSKEYANIFMGYGTDHDAYLMTELSNNNMGSYFFIDALEKASFVYGEITHHLLNKVAEKVIVRCINCEIYNYITNQWSSELYIGSLSKGNEKIYQLRSTNPTNSSFSIHLNACDCGSVYYPKERLVDCTKYAFRQRTQELLYLVKTNTFNSKEKNNNIFHYFHDDLDDETTKLKEQVYSFLNELMDYIKTNQLEEDKFLKMLCDDLYISYNTIGTEYAGIYTCARQTSQGRQTTYNVSLNREFKCIASPSLSLSSSWGSPLFPHVSRNNKSKANPDRDNDSDSDSDNGNNSTSFYTLSDNLDSPYATQDVLDTIRTVSSTSSP